MKKKALLLCVIISTLLIFIGCDVAGVVGGNSFNPPDWIIGTWSDSGDNINYQFSSDNVVYTAPSVSINFKELYGPIAVDVDETITATTYEIRVTAEGTTSKYTFECETPTSVAYSITTSGVTIGPVVLNKQ